MSSGTTNFLAEISEAAAPFAISALFDADFELTLIVSEKLSRAEILAEDSAFFLKNLFAENRVPSNSKKKKNVVPAEKNIELKILSFPRKLAESAPETAFENACD